MFFKIKKTKNPNFIKIQEKVSVGDVSKETPN